MRNCRIVPVKVGIKLYFDAFRCFSTLTHLSVRPTSKTDSGPSWRCQLENGRQIVNTQLTRTLLSPQIKYSGLGIDLCHISLTSMLFQVEQQRFNRVSKRSFLGQTDANSASVECSSTHTQAVFLRSLCVGWMLGGPGFSFTLMLVERACHSRHSGKHSWGCNLSSRADEAYRAKINWVLQCAENV